MFGIIKMYINCEIWHIDETNLLLQSVKNHFQLPIRWKSKIEKVSACDFSFLIMYFILNKIASEIVKEL